MPAVMASAVLCSTPIERRQSSSTAEACVKNLQARLRALSAGQMP
jgi:hypothetical protein